MPENRGLVARLNSFIRWMLLAILVCAAGLVVGRQFLVEQLDEQIRARVEALIAGHYKHLQVRVEGARRLEGKGPDERAFGISRGRGET